MRSDRKISSEYFVVTFHPRVTAGPRVCDHPCRKLKMIIPKRSVPLAVQRNRIKRVVRESTRQIQGNPLTVRIRSGADKRSNSELFSELRQILQAEIGGS